MSTAIKARPTLNATATRERGQFISQFHAICGHERVPLLWLPKGTDTTTSTTDDRNARTITWDATVAARLSALGMGYAQSFNGTSQYGSTPDIDALSFGDGINDSPFSVGVLANLTSDTTTDILLAKYDETTGSTKREYRLYKNVTTKYPFFEVWDESTGAANARIGRNYNTAVTFGAWRLWTATYNGTRALSGMNIFENGTRRDDTVADNGTYVACENTASLFYIGAQKSTGAVGGHMVGSLALAFVVSRELHADDLWQLVNLCNWYFNLSLTV